VFTMKKAETNHRWLTDLITIAVFFGIFYALWIGSHALFTPDEGRYSEVAREMVVTHDYITPRLNGVVFLDKPIFYYWLQASAIQLFGIKEWALRFWPALMGVLGSIVTYSAGRFLFNRRTGFLAALIVATSPLYFGAAHYANLDLEVAVLISCSLMFFIMGIQESRQQSKLLLTSYVFAGLAALTKGLIGIVFPAMIIGSWILLLGRWQTFKKMRLISGLCLFTVIALPWYVMVQKANPEFFQFFFVKQQVSRFLTTEHFNNRTPMWFYLPIVLAGIFPWCFFVFQALTQAVKNCWRARQEYSTQLYLVLWIILVFVFFSVPKSKTVGYILPIFPAIALLIGNYFDTSWEKRTKSLNIGLWIFLMVSIGIVLATPVAPFFNWFNHPALAPFLIVNALIFSVISAVTLLLLLKKNNTAPFFQTIAVSAIAFLLIISASSGELNQKTIKPMALEIKPALTNQDEIVAFYKYFQDLPIYLEKRITIVANWNAADIPLKDNWLRELWYGMPYQDTKNWLIDEDTFWQRWNSNKRLFVFADAYQYTNLLKKSRGKIYKIAEMNNTVLVSNKPATTSSEKPKTSQT